MNQKLKIGIDVGGTNTDVALLTADNTVLHSTKINTTHGVINSIQQGLEVLHGILKQTPHQLMGIFIGSTYATNALLQPELLQKVGVIRIGSTMTGAVPPGFTFPEELKKIIVGAQTIHGGNQINGKELAPTNSQEIELAINRLLEAGMQSCAIIGTFAPLFPEHEQTVAESLSMLAPHIPTTCSYKLGGLNFLERENSTICNAALIQTLTKEFSQIHSIMKALNYNCPLFMIQNNGTTITMDEACMFPIKTIAAGPANSLMGGMLLAQEATAIIVDIGGTSTDIGVVKQNYPQQSFGGSAIGGVSFNIPRADVHSIALGGGSIVSRDKQNKPIIGPRSIAKELTTKAISFGGSILTLFDCAVAVGLIKELRHLPPPLEPKTAHMILTDAGTRIAQQLETLLLQTPKAPIILVGGSTFLEPFIQKALPDQTIIVPPYAAVANAFGAACARISGIIDTSASLASRAQTLHALAQQAKDKAEHAGAREETITIIDQQIMPYGYSTDNAARVVITAAGYL